MVEAYVAAAGRGLSINAALDSARGTLVSRTTLARYVRASGVGSLARTDALAGTAAASAARRVFTLEDLRGLEFTLTETVAGAIARLDAAVRGPDGAVDPERVTPEVMVEAARVSVVLRRVAQMDADLDRRGASSTPNPQAGEDEDLGALVAGFEASWRVMEGGKQ